MIAHQSSSSALSPKSNVVFSSTAATLKVTSMSTAPFLIYDGVINILHDSKRNLFTYQVIEKKGSKQRSVPLKDIDKIVLRGSQFTVCVKNQAGQTIQLMGSDCSGDDAKNLTSLMENIKHRRFENINGVERSPGKGLGTSASPVVSHALESRNRGVLKENVPLGHVRSHDPRTPSQRSPLEVGDLVPASMAIKDGMDVCLGETPKKSSAGDVKGLKSFYGENRTLRYGCVSPLRAGPCSRKSIFGLPKLNKDSLTFQHRNNITINNSSSDVADPHADRRDLTGFLNIGNTCYMNAILQCLLGVPTFSQDLTSSRNLGLVGQNSLYSALCYLAILQQSNQDHKSQKTALGRVKQAISSAATRFSGYVQHDAQEFLCQCLDQLKDDVKIDSAACPVEGNFGSTVRHSIYCSQCGETVTKEERCYSFSLVIPERDENSSPTDLSIQQLFEQFFLDEDVDYHCEKCDFKSAVLSHAFVNLPRIIILHIKRYEYNLDFSKDAKKSDVVRIPNRLVLSLMVQPGCEMPRKFVLREKQMSMAQYSDITSGSLACATAEKRKSSEASDSAFATPRKIAKVSTEAILFGLPSEACQRGVNARPTASDQNSGSLRESKLIALPPCGNLEKAFSNFRSSPGAAASSISEPFATIEVAAKQNVDESTGTALSTPGKDLQPSEYGADLEDEQLRLAIELSLKELEDTRTKFRAEVDEISKSVPSSEVRSLHKYESSLPPLDSAALPEAEGNAGADASARSYNLIGIVSHIGDDTRTGHYVSDVLDFKSGKWRSFNDSSVSEVTENDVCLGRRDSAYLVFYMHNKIFETLL